MANELMRSGQKYLANNDDRAIRKDVGEGLFIAGGGGAALLLVGAALPFISAWLVMVLAAIAGLAMMLKK